MIPYVAAAETTGVGLVAAVLLLSGFGKIRHPIAAALAIVRFGLLPSVHVWAGRLAGVKLQSQWDWLCGQQWLSH